MITEFEYLSEQTEATEATDPTGGVIYMILPDGSGNWLSRKISVSNLQADLIDELNTISTATNNIPTPYLDKNKSAAFTRAVDADSKVTEIDIKIISGSPTVKIGTTLGGEDILLESELTGDFANVQPHKNFDAAGTLYFSVSGGTISVYTRILANQTFE
jgi:hypothetical protein